MLIVQVCRVRHWYAARPPLEEGRVGTTLVIIGKSEWVYEFR